MHPLLSGNGHLNRVAYPYRCMKAKHPIEAHKGLTAPVILRMMPVCNNFSTGPWIYPALHDGYGFFMLLKDRILLLALAIQCLFAVD
jgi:hypothetical protein